MNFAIVNLGCKVNRVESDSFASGLLARGGVETSPIPPMWWSSTRAPSPGRRRRKREKP